MCVDGKVNYHSEIVMESIFFYLQVIGSALVFFFYLNKKKGLANRNSYAALFMYVLLLCFCSTLSLVRFVDETN